MILTNDGGYAFAGIVMTGEWTNSYGPFLTKTYPEQGAFVKPVLK